VARETELLRSGYYVRKDGAWEVSDVPDFGFPVLTRQQMYEADNPVDGTDPSGHDDLASLSVSESLGAGLAAFSGAVLLEAKTHIIGTLAVATYNEASADGASLAATAESILSVYRTSVRDLIKQAEDTLEQTGRALKKIKVVPMPKSIIPAVAANITAAEASGKPMVLTRATAAQAIINRRNAIAGHPPAGLGDSLDEYPFASSAQGGFGAVVAPVPAIQNSIQGGIIGGCYKIENITVGTPYIVIVTP